ncbi:MAG: dihydropteroate synthase [Candidatus Aminicenantales bacterium]
MRMIIVGERLNSTREVVREALRRRDEAWITAEALRQKEAGADYLDLNAAALLEDETAALRWAIPLIWKTVSIPVAIDSPNPGAIAAGLEAHGDGGRALLNSITAETIRIESLVPLIREHRPRVVALCLDDRGLPESPEAALSIARKLAERLGREGLDPGDLFIDPLVRPVGAEPGAARLFLDSLTVIKAALPGVLTIAGLSNVSFGLPLRPLINRTLLALAAGRGLDAAICNPLDRDLAASRLAAEALLDRDPSMKSFLRFARSRVNP